MLGWILSVGISYLEASNDWLHYLVFGIFIICEFKTTNPSQIIKAKGATIEISQLHKVPIPLFKSEMPR